MCRPRQWAADPNTAAGVAPTTTAQALTTVAPVTAATVRSAQTPPVAAGAVPDLELSLKATRGQVSILPGAETAVWRYQAVVAAGDPASVVALPGSYLGPVLRVRQGQRLRVRFTNDLPEPSIVHWHGLLVPDDMDGHPRFAVAPGQSYTYDFPVLNRAGTYWFHPHPHGLTGGQAYRGLAGLLIVSDDEEAALELPQGEYDLPLILQDRQFDARNQLVYIAQGNSGMMGGGMMGGGMTQMMGFLGDRILVNGQPDFTAAVATRPYASISGQHCWLYQAGELTGNWRCSTGRKESPTVPGAYKIQSRINPAYASRWDFWMPYWLGLYYAGSTENGIHSLMSPTSACR